MGVFEVYGVVKFKHKVWCATFRDYDEAENYMNKIAQMPEYTGAKIFEVFYR